MISNYFRICFKGKHRFLRQQISMFMIAIMLGVSNVILEEDRTMYDTRAKIEQQEVQPEDDPLNYELY